MGFSVGGDMAKLVKGGTMNVNGFQVIDDGLKVSWNPYKESIATRVSHGKKLAGLLA